MSRSRHDRDASNDSISRLRIIVSTALTLPCGMASQNGHLLANTAEWFILSESLFHDCDEIPRQVAEIAQHLMLDLSVFKKRPSQIERGVRDTVASIADLSDMHFT